MAETSTNSPHEKMMEFINISSNSSTADTTSEDEFLENLKLIQSYLHEDKNVPDETTEFEIGILDIGKISRYCLSSFSFSKYPDFHLNDVKILCLRLMTFWLNEINFNHSRIQYIKEFCDWSEFYFTLKEKAKQKSTNEPKSEAETAEATLYQELQARVKNYKNCVTIIILSEAHMIKPEIFINILRSLKVGNTICKGLFNPIEDPINKMLPNVLNLSEDELIQEPQKIKSIFKQIRLLHSEIFYSLDKKRAYTKYLAFYMEQLEKSSLKISRFLLCHNEEILSFPLGIVDNIDDYVCIPYICRLVLTIASKSLKDSKEKDLYRNAMNGILDFFFDCEKVFLGLIKDILKNKDPEIIAVLFESDIWTNQVFVRKTVPLLDFPDSESIFSLKLESKRASLFLFLIAIMHSSIEKIHLFSQEALRLIRNIDKYHLIMLYKYLESWSQIDREKDERTTLYLNMVLTDVRKFNPEKFVISMLEESLDIQSFMDCLAMDHKSLEKLEQNRSKYKFDKKMLISSSMSSHLERLKSILEYTKKDLNSKRVFTILNALMLIDDTFISEWISSNFEIEYLKNLYLGQHLVFSEANLKNFDKIITFWDNYVKSSQKDIKEHLYCEILWDFVLRTENSYVTEVCLEKIFQNSNLSISTNFLHRKQILKYLTQILETQYENQATLQKKIVMILSIIEDKFSLNLKLEEYSARPHYRLTNTRFISKSMNYEGKVKQKEVQSKLLLLPNNISYYEYLDICRGFIGLEKCMLGKLECSPYNLTSKAFNIEDDDNRLVVLQGKSLFDHYYPEKEYPIPTFDNKRLEIVNKNIIRCFDELFIKFLDKSEFDKETFFDHLLNCYGNHQTYDLVKRIFIEFRIPQSEFFDKEKFLNFNIKRLLESDKIIISHIMSVFGPELKEINFDSFLEEQSIVGKIFIENPQLFLMIWNLITNQEAGWKIYKFLSKIQTNQLIFSRVLNIEENSDWKSYFDFDCLPKFIYKIHLIAHILSNKSDDFPNSLKEDARLFGEDIEKKRSNFQQKFFSYGGLEFFIKNLEEITKELSQAEECMHNIRPAISDIASILNHYLRIGLIFRSPVLAFGADVFQDQFLDSKFR